MAFGLFKKVEEPQARSSLEQKEKPASEFLSKFKNIFKKKVTRVVEEKESENPGTLKLSNLLSLSPEFVIHTFVIQKDERQEFLEDLDFERTENGDKKAQIMLLYRLHKNGILPLSDRDKNELTRLFRGDIKLEEIVEVIPQYIQNQPEMDSPTEQEESDERFKFSKFIQDQGISPLVSHSNTKELVGVGGKKVSDDISVTEKKSDEQIEMSESIREEDIQVFREKLIDQEIKKTNLVAPSSEMPEKLKNDKVLAKEEWEAFHIFDSIILTNVDSVRNMIAQAEQVINTKTKYDAISELPETLAFRNKKVPELQESLRTLKAHIALFDRQSKREKLPKIISTLWNKIVPQTAITSEMLMTEARTLKDTIDWSGFTIEHIGTNLVTETISDEDIDNSGTSIKKIDSDDKKKQR